MAKIILICFDLQILYMYFPFSTQFSRQLLCQNPTYNGGVIRAKS